MTEHSSDKIPPLPDDAAIPTATDLADTSSHELRLDLSQFSPDPTPYGSVNSSEIPAPPYSTLELPEDLRIPWSWIHLSFFLVSSLASFVVLPVLVALGVQLYTRRPQFQFQQLASNASFLVATQVLCFAAVIFFLYMTLGVLRHAPFWSTLGWRKFDIAPNGKVPMPWIFPAIGGGLALFVAVATSRLKDTENAPIEQLFKDRHAAFLLMGMAVLIAPLVEETVFRGYLYPLFASNLAKLAAYYGVDSSRAIRFGMTSGVLATGFLFGMMHGWQLGWNVALVSLLTLVGVIFTFARAATGTVLASFLMHLGYNSLIAVITVIATKGFTVTPPGH
jgi:membrane protease YdiL (CAAX protease family)